MYVLSLYGYGSGRPVYPLTEVSDEAKETVRMFIEQSNVEEPAYAICR